jgi:serine protease Do
MTSCFRIFVRALVVLAGILELPVYQVLAQTAAVPPADHANALSSAFRFAAERVSPAVVTVIAARREERFSIRLPDGKRIMAPENRGDEAEDDSIGSGVNIHDSGIVLTNAHVVANADAVRIRTPDGREIAVRSMKIDSLSDIALLQLDIAPGLPAAKLGNSDALQIGDWVIAIGSPFELETTVSAGIISGKGRGISKIKRGKLLQTDAAINPGNSGGPLVSLTGEVIGINTAIASSSGGYQGIGFAIPSNQVRWVAEQLLRNGRVTRSFLGVDIEDFAPADARDLGLPPLSGVLIKMVRPRGPAAESGLHANDVIVEFAGQRVFDARDLQAVVEQQPDRSVHRVKIVRDGKFMELEVMVAQMDDE